MNNCKKTGDSFVLYYQGSDGEFYVTRIKDRKKLNRFMNCSLCYRVVALRASAIFEDKSINLNELHFTYRKFQ